MEMLLAKYATAPAPVDHPEEQEEQEDAPVGNAAAADPDLSLSYPVRLPVLAFFPCLYQYYILYYGMHILYINGMYTVCYCIYTIYYVLYTTVCIYYILMDISYLCLITMQHTRTAVPAKVQEELDATNHRLQELGCALQPCCVFCPGAGIVIVDCPLCAASGEPSFMHVRRSMKRTLFCHLIEWHREIADVIEQDLDSASDEDTLFTESSYDSDGSYTDGNIDDGSYTDGNIDDGSYTDGKFTETDVVDCPLKIKNVQPKVTNLLHYILQMYYQAYLGVLSGAYSRHELPRPAATHQGGAGYFLLEHYPGSFETGEVF